MAKNNIRSVRFSDEMIEIINQQVGDNFTQKIVTHQPHAAARIGSGCSSAACYMAGCE